MGLTLRRLTALEEGKMTAELAELGASIESLQRLMAEDGAVYEVIKKETAELSAKHAVARRSVLVKAEGELSDQDLLANER